MRTEAERQDCRNVDLYGGITVTGGGLGDEGTRSSISSSCALCR